MFTLAGRFNFFLAALQAFKASQDRPKLTEYANKLAQCRRRLRQLQQAVATINTRIQNVSFATIHGNDGINKNTLKIHQPMPGAQFLRWLLFCPPNIRDVLSGRGLQPSHFGTLGTSRVVQHVLCSPYPLSNQQA